MDLVGKIAEYQWEIQVYGFALFLFIAGASKFVVLDYWLGYEPQFIVQLIPLTAGQLTQLGGLFELILGLGIAFTNKKFYFASAATIWLSGITLQMLNLGFWDLMVRDLGLTLYGLTVYSRLLRQ